MAIRFLPVFHMASLQSKQFNEYRLICILWHDDDDQVQQTYNLVGSYKICVCCRYSENSMNHGVVLVLITVSWAHSLHNIQPQLSLEQISSSHRIHRYNYIPVWQSKWNHAMPSSRSYVREHNLGYSDDYLVHRSPS